MRTKNYISRFVWLSQWRPVLDILTYIIHSIWQNQKLNEEKNCENVTLFEVLPISHWHTAQFHLLGRNTTVTYHITSLFTHIFLSYHIPLLPNSNTHPRHIDKSFWVGFFFGCNICCKDQPKNGWFWTFLQANSQSLDKVYE